MIKYMIKLAMAKMDMTGKNLHQIFVTLLNGLQLVNYSEPMNDFFYFINTVRIVCIFSGVLRRIR